MESTAAYRLVACLGNPGSQYQNTRHNVGFMVGDELARRGATSFAFDQKWNSDTARTGGRTLMKPQTFMNRSGEPLQSFLSFRKIPISQVIVVHDEIDLPLGVVRVKIDGGEGGHNGLRSISTVCGGRNYARVRVGIGKPPPGSPLAQDDEGIATWVLSRFSREEGPFVEELVIKAAAAVVLLAREGLRAAQNRFNG